MPECRGPSRLIFLGLPLIALAMFAGLLLTASAQSATPRTAEVRDHLQKAAESLKANDADAAVKEFNAVLAIDPKNADAFANLGVIAFVQNDCRLASQQLRKALQIQPSLVKTQALLGICEKRLGEPSAKATLSTSFSKLKEVKLRSQVGLELAGLYFQEGDLERASSVVQTLVNLNPDDIDILYMAQLIYTELADDTLNKLALLAPNSARMQQVIAEHLVSEGDARHAVDHYRKALQMDSRLPGVRFELGEAILESSPADPETQAEAEKEFDDALAVDGDSAKTEAALGSIALSKSDRENARAHYERAYKLDPNEVEAQLGLAKLLMMQQKPQEATHYLRAVIQSDPLNGEAHYRLALACRNLNLKDEAEKEMKLFQEIKQAKDQVKELYRQMNKARRSSEDEVSASDETK